MSATLSTALLSASDRAETWHHAVSHTFIPMGVDFLEEEPSPGTIVSRQLGSVRISRVEAGPQMVTRSRRMISENDTGALIVSLQQRGTAIKEQDGRETVIRPGEFSITDSSRVFQKKLEEGFVFTSFVFPRAELDVQEKDLQSLTATSFSPSEGTAALVATFLARVAREAAVLDECVGGRAAATALDLLALLIDDRCGRTRSQLPPNEASLERVKEHILRNLHDPDLSPSKIAEATCMSVRFLHKLFQPEGVTVGGWIRTQRLERCGRDLRRPMAGDLGVAGIARRWGFVNPSHFSRAFRLAYGMSPRDWQASWKSAE